MSTFAIYLIGMLIVIGGLAYLATLLHVPTPWIIGGAVVLLGIGVLGGATKTRRNHHEHARTDQQQAETHEHLEVHQRMYSGSRRIRSAENPDRMRSIHGKVSAKPTKIAAARGMNARTLS